MRNKRPLKTLTAPQVNVFGRKRNEQVGFGDALEEYAFFFKRKVFNLNPEKEQLLPEKENQRLGGNFKPIKITYGTFGG